MKKISILLALVLSLSLLSACGGNESEVNTGNPPSDPSVNSQQAPDESAEPSFYFLTSFSDFTMYSYILIQDSSAVFATVLTPSSS